VIVILKIIVIVTALYNDNHTYSVIASPILILVLIVIVIHSQSQCY